MVLRVDQKNLGKTARLKKDGGSMFKNWIINASDGHGNAIQLRGPRYIWNKLQIDTWYDLTLEPTRIRASVASDWIISAESNDYRKKLMLLESHGIIFELGAIILEYSFPTIAIVKPVRRSYALKSEDDSAALLDRSPR